jgi:anti-sigma factor RsiW
MTLSCEEARELVHAHADGELDVANHARVEAHLGECASCAASHERILALRGALAGLASEMPSSVERRLRRTLGATRSRARVVWALELAAVLVVGLALGVVFGRRSSESGIEREMVASHVRSLMAAHLVDVESTDQHTVKPWFEGKVAFAPRVANLAEKGFPLVGGRLDFVGEKTVAALVYKRRAHAINVFVFPEDGPDAPVARSAGREGYNVFRWRRSGLAYVAVSELVASELEDFARLLDAQ